MEIKGAIKKCFPQPFSACICSMSLHNYLHQLIWNWQSWMTLPVYPLVWTWVVRKWSRNENVSPGGLDSVSCSTYDLSSRQEFECSSDWVGYKTRYFVQLFFILMLFICSPIGQMESFLCYILHISLVQLGNSSLTTFGGRFMKKL